MNISIIRSLQPLNEDFDKVKIGLDIEYIEQDKQTLQLLIEHITATLFGTCGMSQKEVDYSLSKYSTFTNGKYKATLVITDTLEENIIGENFKVVPIYYVVNDEILKIREIWGS